MADGTNRRALAADRQAPRQALSEDRPVSWSPVKSSGVGRSFALRKAFRCGQGLALLLRRAPWEWLSPGLPGSDCFVHSETVADPRSGGRQGLS